MSLKTIIQRKDKTISKLLSQFESEFDSFAQDVQKEIIAIFRRGAFDKESLINAFVQNGFDDNVEAWGARYANVIGFTKEISDEIGYKFILTSDTIEKFDTIQNVHIEKMLDMKQNYANDMRDFAIQYELEGKRFTDIQFKDYLNSTFDTMKRRLSTEAITGISIADRVLKNDFFSQAKIERFQYVGPNDNVTRDSCRNTLSDPRQDTGWTMAEINSSETPFVQCGGWNCRHEWLPMIEGL